MSETLDLAWPAFADLPKWPAPGTGLSGSPRLSSAGTAVVLSPQDYEAARRALKFNRRLLDALRPLAALAKADKPTYANEWPLYDAWSDCDNGAGDELNVGHIRAAAALIAELTGEAE